MVRVIPSSNIASVIGVYLNMELNTIINGMNDRMMKNAVCAANALI